MSRFAIRRRFCAVAASKNSSYAPVGPTQSQVVTLQDAVEVSGEHFHLLSLTARFPVRGRCRYAPGLVAGSFVNAAGDVAHWRIRTCDLEDAGPSRNLRGGERRYCSIANGGLVEATVRRVSLMLRSIGSWQGARHG